MTPLALLYAQFLDLGFILLRLAIESGNRDWINAELELLHNVPSLLAEKKKGRHRHFWDNERSKYIKWVTETGTDEAKSRMRTYYQPIWNEMEPLILQMLAREDSSNDGTSAETWR